MLSLLIDSLYGIGSLWQRPTLAMIRVKTEFARETRQSVLIKPEINQNVKSISMQKKKKKKTRNVSVGAQYGPPANIHRNGMQQ